MGYYSDLVAVFASAKPESAITPIAACTYGVTPATIHRGAAVIYVVYTIVVSEAAGRYIMYVNVLENTSLVVFEEHALTAHRVQTWTSGFGQ